MAAVRNSGISTLFPPQEEAFRSGVLEGDNLVLAVPTSAGKTLVAEVAILKSISEGRGRALYLVPLRSLAREKYLDFNKYEEIGIRVAISIGDYDSAVSDLRQADIVVMTTERADALLRHYPDYMTGVGIVIVDEVHLINDTHRGPTLEVLVAKMRRLAPQIQIVALSATISNADEIAKWLDARLVRSDWRPVPLEEGVVLEGDIYFANGRVESFRRRRYDDVLDLVMDTLDGAGQILIFVSSRRNTMALARRVAPVVRTYLQESDARTLEKIAQRLVARPSVSETTVALANVVRGGAAFHHAGLTNSERAVIEELFKANALKAIVATPTLAAGVNLPARRVVIRDYRRYEADRGNRPIPVLEYKQMAGRAGRPSYDERGEALLIAKTPEECDGLLERYVLAETERIRSRLADQDVLQFHLLATIASGLTQKRREIDDLVAQTFYGHQYKIHQIEYEIDSAIEFLIAGELVKLDGQQYLATPLGERVSQLYIAPSTALLFRDLLGKRRDITEIGALHMLCHSQDQPLAYVTRSEIDELELFLETHLDELLLSPPDSWDEEEYGRFLGELKTARILMSWISEETERSITEQFSVGMGDVHRFAQSAEWLAYSASEISHLIGAFDLVRPFRELQSRLKYGVRAELLPLVRLRGIGRVRGRMLYQHGFKSVSNLVEASVEAIARVPAIGTRVAEALKAQITEYDSAGGNAAVEIEDGELSDLQLSLEDFL